MPSSWSGRRNLVGSVDDRSITSVSDVVDSVQRSLYTSLPPWCSYVGVTCDTATESSTYASVIFIYLPQRRLTGTLPSSIGNLTSLSYVDLGANSLTGTIPSSVGSLTSLSQLFLDNNQLTGTIPSTLNNLYLAYLVLSYNYLTMGSATTVPISTFSSYTLSSFQGGEEGGNLDLSQNCLAFSYGSISVSATHCRPTSSKSRMIFEIETSRSWSLRSDKSERSVCIYINYCD